MFAMYFASYLPGLLSLGKNHIICTATSFYIESPKLLNVWKPLAVNFIQMGIFS